MSDNCGGSQGFDMVILGVVVLKLINRMHFSVQPQDCLSGVFVSLFVAKNIRKFICLLAEFR